MMMMFQKRKEKTIIIISETIMNNNIPSDFPAKRSASSAISRQLYHVFSMLQFIVLLLIAGVLPSSVVSAFTQQQHHHHHHHHGKSSSSSTLMIRKSTTPIVLLSLRAKDNDDNDNDYDGMDGTGVDLTKFLNQMLSSGGGSFEVSGPFTSADMNGGGGGGGGGDDDDDGSSNTNAASADKSLEALLSFDLKPKEVVEYLDQFVISQTDAKKVLAVAICDHYNHCRRCLLREQQQKAASSSKQEREDILQALSSSSSSSTYSFDYAKPNVLLAGPTGVGKTYLLKCLARLVGVPFVKADATKFSETGIVGRDAEDLVRDLVDKANGNTTLASVGIIYLDEVDKIAAGGSEGGSGTETKGSFNTRGVQNNFLKLLEETDVSLDRQSDMVIANLPFGMGGGGNKPKSISTKNILFIFSGAFTNLDKDIKRKKEKRSFGLDLTQTANGGGSAASMDDDSENSGKPRSYLQYAETADFIRAGLEPEFVGRVPVRVALDALDAEDLKQILVGSEGSVLKQFVRDMEGYDINMTVTDDALNEVAKRAEKEGTGARGLVTILEQTLRQHKYELPSTSIAEFVLDRATVMNPELGLHRLLATTSTDDEMGVLLRDLKRWEQKLKQKLPPSADAWLTDDAINYMVLRTLEAGEGGNIGAYTFATRHFGNDALADVIAKVHEATSQRLFPISLEVAKNPKVELQKWLDLLE